MPTLWSGDLGDQIVVPETEIVKMANKYFNPQAIVIGHLNHLPVTHVYGQLVDMIRCPQPRTVTLNDVFLNRRCDESRNHVVSPISHSGHSKNIRLFIGAPHTSLPETVI